VLTRTRNNRQIMISWSEARVWLYYNATNSDQAQAVWLRRLRQRVWSVLVVNNQWRVSRWALQCAWWRSIVMVSSVVSGWTRGQLSSRNALCLSGDTWYTDRRIGWFWSCSSDGGGCTSCCRSPGNSSSSSSRSCSRASAASSRFLN